MLYYLRCPRCPYRVPPWWGGQREGEFIPLHICFSTWFSHNEYRPLRWEYCICPFTACPGRVVTRHFHYCACAGAGKAMEGWDGRIWVSAALVFVFCFFLLEKVTARQQPLPFAPCLHLLLGQPSWAQATQARMLPPRIQASPDCRMGIANRSSSAAASLLGLQGVPHCICGSCPHLSPPLAFSAHSDMPTLRSLNRWISDVCVCGVGNVL